MEVKGNHFYQENNFINAYRINLKSSIPATYFDMLYKDIEAIQHKTNRKSEIQQFLKNEFKTFYSEIGIVTDDNQEEKTLEDSGMGLDSKYLSEMDIYWYKNITCKIRRHLICEELSGNLWDYLQEEGKIFVENPFLAVFYDYNALNDKAKNIVTYGSLSSSTYYPVLSINPSKLNDAKIKMRATKELIDDLVMHPDAGVTFIFWALMVLTADYSDYNQHLSEICNMADLIGMNDKVILDIMDIINLIYSRVEPEKIELRSEITKYVFKYVVSMYGVNL